MIDYKGFAFAKPEARNKQKEREDRQHDKAREDLRLVVWNRDSGRCRRCGAACKLKSDNLFDLAHVHEIVSRAQGGDDLDSKNCLVLCSACHLRGIHHQMAPPHEWFRILIISIDGANAKEGVAFESYREKHGEIA